MTRDTAGQLSRGTYEINPERKEIKVRIAESIGNTNFRISYELKDGVLILNEGKFTKQ